MANTLGAKNSASNTVINFFICLPIVRRCFIKPCLLLLVALPLLAQGAFPTINNTRTGFDPTGVTNHPIDLNATIAAGDLITIVGTCDSGDAITWDNSTAGVWTNLWDTVDGTVFRFVAYALDAVGTEDGAQLTVTTATIQKCSWISIRILAAVWQGTLGSGVANGTSSVATTTTPNPPSVTPKGGSEDNLIIAALGMDLNKTISAYSLPDNNVFVTEGGTGGTGTAISSDELTASPNDPGTYTISATEDTAVNTFAVSPAGGGSTVAVQRRMRTRL